MGGYFNLGNQTRIPFTMFTFSFRIREKYQFCSVVTSIISLVSENNNIYSATCEYNWDPSTRFMSFAGPAWNPPESCGKLNKIANGILQKFDVTLNTNSLIIIFFCVNKNLLFLHTKGRDETWIEPVYGVAKECYKIFIIRLAKRFI